MKINQSILVFAGLLSLGVASALADFTFDPTTLKSGNPNVGVIWFDTVGTMSYDVNDNPINVSGGTLGNQTVKVDFVFSSGGSVVGRSQVYTLDAGNFGTITGRGIETVSSGANLAGQTVTYQVEAWVGGTSYTDGANTKTGLSSASNNIKLGGGILAPDAANNFANFAVTAAVPEPTTCALGLFGAVGILFRRRK